MLACHNKSYLHSRLRLISAKVFPPSVANFSVATELPKSKDDLKPIKEKANVVIVGGGVVGTSMAYHLAKRGMKDVLLLEKTELTAGSTWHAAGLTTYFHPGINLKKIHYYSLNLYKELEKETGVPVGLHTPGSIRLCVSNERMDEAYYQQSRANWNDAEQSIITPEEIEKMHPLLNMDSVLGGIYNPGDGHIDPYSVTMSLAKGARMHGATIKQHSPVKGLEAQSNGRWNVEVEDGVIDAGAVINCAGFWGRELAQMAGLDLPLVTVEHQYLITDSIKELSSLTEELPVIRDLEASYYCRQERQGLLVGPYESAEKMKVREDWQHRGVPPGFGKELYEPDLDRIMDHVVAASERIPLMQEAGIQNITCGPICYSPDVLPIVGPLPGAPNFWVANGMAYGIAHAGGCGDYLAQWMIDGEPPFDLLEIDPARYGEWTTPAYVAAKARESYGDNNLITHPHQEKQAGREIRTTPNFDLQKQRGAEMGFHNGWEQPHWYAQDGDDAGYKPSFYRTNWFEPVRRECNTIMNEVGLIDLTPFSKFMVEGPDARKFMEYLCANTMPREGKANISHMLTSKGKVMAELTVTRVAKDAFYLVSGSGSELHDLRWIKQHSLDFPNCSISNLTGQYGVLGVAGPNSRELLQRLTHTNLDDSAFPFLSYKSMAVGSVPTKAIRISFTGELGWELHYPIEYSRALYTSLLEVGQDLGIKDVGTYAVNSLRLEKGFRVWGHEMNKDTTPLEAGLHAFVKPNKKSPFIGREAIHEQLETGLEKQLVMFEVETTDRDCTGDEAIWQGDQVVGHTTSGAYGYTVEKSLAFGYLSPKALEDGEQLEVELVGKRFPAAILPSPPVLIESIRKNV